MEMSVNLSDKTAIITGAAQGIGKSVAKGIVESGARVLAVDIADSIRDVPGKLEGKYEPCQTDVSDPQSVEKMVLKCVELFGAPDLLINIAGITNPCSVQNMSLDTWQQMIDVNLTSVFLTTQYVLPYMIEKQKGSMINFSSIYAETGGVTCAHYSAAKAGIEAFSKALAREVGGSGIRVNVIAPGLIETGMTDLMRPEQKNALIKRTPLQRIGHPDDFIGPVLLLASNAGSYITGQIIRVNGGRTMS